MRTIRMALFRRLPPDVKSFYYTSKGFYAYVVPIYLLWEEGVDYESGEHEMFICERNGIPSGSIVVAKFLWELLTVFHPLVPPVHVTGDI